ncbi:MAG TPA: MATE family efflux transporter [Thermoplasmatales archaeon]|nr:MATE family efflux transporter [Thermoplasmatales archaeon]
MERVTEGVKTLLGNPKKAIIKLAIPMIVGMASQIIYNLVDAIWVSGLGADALAAVGFFFPFFFLLMALATGIGVGGSSAISRKIGEKRKEDADTIAIHSMIIGIIIAICVGLPFFIFSEEIFSGMGAGKVTEMAVDYAKILFGGSIFIFFSSISNAILRGEGDAKRSMYAMLMGSVMNIILDPIFIYLFNMGVKGAAVATLISMIATSIMFFNWLFMKRDTYVSIHFGNFKFRWDIIKEILKVGLPASVIQLSMSFSMLALNVIVVRTGGTDGVAVFTTGWRIVMIGTLPLLGMATAVTAVTGASYGARNAEKLNTAYMYAVKIGFFIEGAVALFTYFFAPWIAIPFTNSSNSARIADDLIEFLKMIVFFYPFVTFGIFTSAMFQGVGKGINSLIVTVLRTLIITIPMAYVFGITLSIGLKGIWIGIVTGNSLSAIFTFIWGRIYVKNLFKIFETEKKVIKQI